MLLIGWDAADWKIINPLMDHGLMPALNQLVDKGVIADIETLQPSLSPMLWTSIATGKTADKHGILGFVEADKKSQGVKPVTVSSRKSAALWNILNHQGYTCNVFNWWPSHPAENIDGIMVSNFFNQATAEYGKEWPVSEGAVYPEKLLNSLKELRVHPGEISPEMVMPFIPKASETSGELADEDYAKVEKIMKFLAQCTSTHAQVTWAMENTAWDFTAVYLETIDKFCHTFMRFTAPKMDKVTEKDFELYQYVINAVYVFHDMMLQRLLELAGEDTTIVLLSDHGFYSEDRRPKALPKHHASIALQHNPLGIFLMKGPGIKKDERISGMNLLDVTPTLLAHLGIPIGRDMDGKVLYQVFEQKPGVKYIDSWENDIPSVKSSKENTAVETSDVLLKQLAELGYLTLEPNKEEQYSKTQFNSQYHLSVVLRTTNRELEALELLESLYEQDKIDARINLDLINLYVSKGLVEKARSVLSEFRKLNVEKLVNFDLLEIKLLRAEKNNEKAIAKLEELYNKRSNSIPVVLELANCYRIAQRYEDAQKKYETVEELDPHNHIALHGLGVCLLKQGKFEQAADKLLTAVGIHFNTPACHFHLGEALIGMKLYEEAASALETAVYLNTDMNRARKMLIEVYRKHLQNEDKAGVHLNYLKREGRNDIIVVSGLPRSGTSMMMQMLEAGGLETYADHHRPKDENNPRGYYESEKVKRIDRYNAWLEDVEGKAVKIVAPLLKHLKLKYRYKIILMERELDEILLSQQKMKQRLRYTPGSKAPAFDVKLAAAYKEELTRLKQWEKDNPQMEILKVNYTDVIQKPEEQIKRISAFLGTDLNEKKMLKVVDASLYRERLTDITTK